MAENLYEQLFVTHPQQVGESYFEHMATAASFGARMVTGGLACFVHAVVPGVCVRTGSHTIIDLHDRMVKNRVRHGVDPLVHGHSFRDHGFGI